MWTPPPPAPPNWPNTQGSNPSYVFLGRKIAWRLPLSQILVLSTLRISSFPLEAKEEYTIDRNQFRQWGEPENEVLQDCSCFRLCLGAEWPTSGDSSILKCANHCASLVRTSERKNVISMREFWQRARLPVWKKWRKYHRTGKQVTNKSYELNKLSQFSQ